jgi:hypothetical protein
MERIKGGEQMSKELLKAMISLYMFKSELSGLLDKTDTPIDDTIFDAFMSYVAGTIPPDVKAAIDTNFQEVTP